MARLKSNYSEWPEEVQAQKKPINTHRTDGALLRLPLSHPHLFLKFAPFVAKPHKQNTPITWNTIF
jgi:hypothetical protein